MGPVYSQGSLREGAGDRRDLERETTCKTPTDLNLLGGRRPIAEECGQPLEAGKGKETDSPLKPPEQHFSLLIAYLDFF